MTGWAEFITARLDEDEAAARAVIAGPDWHSTRAPTYVDDSAGVRVAACAAQRDGEHIALHDPARVLRQVQAMREILGEHQQKANIAGEWCYNCGSLTWPCANVRSAASIWSDHPDHPEAGR